MDTVKMRSHELAFKRQRKLACGGPPPHMPRVATPLIGLIFVLPDSNAGKLYAIFKCFRDTDTTAKSVSADSNLKNSNTVIYANSGKLKILKNLRFKFRHFLTLI